MKGTSFKDKHQQRLTFLPEEVENQMEKRFHSILLSVLWPLARMYDLIQYQVLQETLL